MSLRKLYAVSFCLTLLGMISFFTGFLLSAVVTLSSSGLNSLGGAVAAVVSSPFVYTFNVSGLLNEASPMDSSSSPYWWVNSGGQLVLSSGYGSTMQGDIPAGDRWHDIYSKNNPGDTDNGSHPQNLFRLVTRSKWSNVEEQASFYIVRDNFSNSSNRNLSNGLLFFSRYQNGNSLYYSGLRVDGTAVIKKKYNGIYYTMAQKKIFPGTYSGTQSNVNLIPHEKWINLLSDTVTNSDGSVTVTLFMRLPGEASWTKLIQATDKKQFGGTPPIIESGYAGIRTDFMDVKFQNFRLKTL